MARRSLLSKAATTNTEYYGAMNGNLYLNYVHPWGWNIL